MENMQDEADLMVKTSNKIDKILNKLDEPTAIAVINYCFLKMVIDDRRGPIVAKAMAATFLHNVMNSINEYYHGDDFDNEPFH